MNALKLFKIKRSCEVLSELSGFVKKSSLPMMKLDISDKTIQVRFCFDMFLMYKSVKVLCFCRDTFLVKSDNKHTSERTSKDLIPNIEKWGFCLL